MFTSLSQWVMGVVSRPSRGLSERHSEDEEAHPPPPFLPPDRAHCLETFPSEDQCTNATANSNFFQRLPPDIRRLIMIEAFGDRMVHVDLRLMELGEALDAQRLFHGCDTHKAGKTAPFSSSNARRQWRWYGCVCHRDPEWRVRDHTITNKTLSPPWFDMCLDTTRDRETVDSRRVCEDWSGQERVKCRVGAMGWLRTCHQA